MYAATIAAIAAYEADYSFELKNFLQSSLDRRSQVDIVMSAWHMHTYMYSIAIDTTHSCPLLSSYLTAASNDALAIICEREKEKDGNHLDVVASLLSICYMRAPLVT